MNVRQLREHAGLSQQELANITGIPKDRIAKWEQGKGAPKSEDSKVLDKYFKENVPRNASSDSLQPQGGAQFSKPLLQKSKEKSKNIMTTVTTRPDYEMRPATNGTHTNENDAVTAIRILAETSKIDSETISKLTDLVTKLIKK